MPDSFHDNGRQQGHQRGGKKEQYRQGGGTIQPRPGIHPEEERMDILFKIGSKYFDEHLFEYANRYFEQINKEFPQNAHSTYFFLIYGYLYLQKPGPFIHYLAKINKELPDTYAALGVDENAQLPDKLFNEAIRVIKDDISKGKLNLNKYL